MGDKTQLLAFSLAARFKRPWIILFGIFTATLLNHSLASSMGSWVAEHLQERTKEAALTVAFLGFGIWALKPDHFSESTFEQKNPYIATVILFFIAEMGDKTQFATMALAARYDSVYLVTLGTTLGMLAADGLALFAGDRLAHRISLKWVRWASSALFFFFGILSAYQAFKSG